MMTRRTLRIATLSALMLLLTPAMLAMAQDDPLEGVHVELLARIPAQATSGQELQFIRITMEPGTTIESHSHPGTVIVMVENGLFRTQFTAGEATIARVGEDVFNVGPEQAHVLRPGDTVAYGGGASHTMRNGGEGPLVLIVAALLDPDEEGFLFHDEAEGMGMDMDDNDDGDMDDEAD